LSQEHSCTTRKNWLQKCVHLTYYTEKPTVQVYILPSHLRTVYENIKQICEYIMETKNTKRTGTYYTESFAGAIIPSLGKQ
jgi:hypothetical protein